MRDNGGSVVNISATLHYTATVLQTHAASAKAAIGKKNIIDLKETFQLTIYYTIVL